MDWSEASLLREQNVDLLSLKHVSDLDQPGALGLSSERGTGPAEKPEIILPCRGPWPLRLDLE